MRRCFIALVAVLALATWEPIALSAAAAGALDTTFSGDGIARSATLSNSDPTSVQVDSFDRVLVGGYDANKPGPLILRYKANGALDTTWGKRYWPSWYGRVIGLGLYGPKALVGFSEGYVVRLNSNGSLDKTFGANGVVTSNALIGAEEIGVDKNGDTFGVANGRAYGTNLVKISQDGHSVRAMPLCIGGASGTGCGEPSALTVSPSYVYVAGHTLIPDDSEGQSSAVVGRFNLSGSLDTTYGLGGYAWRDRTTDGRSGSFAMDLAVSPKTGQVIAVGAACDLSGACRDSFFARFTAAGFPDPTFRGSVWFGDTDGDIFTNSSARAVAMQGGKVVIVGLDDYCDHTYRACFGVERLTASGVPDTTFAGVGYTHTGGTQVGAEDIRIFNQKMIVVGGQYVARYLG